MSWMICAAAVFAALGFALWVRQREKRRLARMMRMLDDALAFHRLQRELSAS